MTRAKKVDKEATIQALKQADEAFLKEQDHYIEVIDRVNKNTGVDESVDICGGCLDTFFATMNDCSYPPHPGDRESWLEIQHNETLPKLKLNKIVDNDIRMKTYFLNETAEHTQRIRAMAMFSERVGPIDGWLAPLFYFWCQWSALTIIFSEACEMEHKSTSKLDLMLQTYNLIIEQVITDVWVDSGACESTLLH